MNGRHSSQRTDGTVPLAILARVLLLSRRRVQQLVAEGHIPKTTDGRYSLVPCIQGYVRFLASKGPLDGAQRLAGEDQARLMKARADIAENEARRVAGGLVTVTDAKDAIDQLAHVIRQQLATVAPQAAPLLAREPEPDRCHAIIAGLVHDALAGLAATVVERR